MDEMKQYSQPNFPAKQAWQAMQEMLDKEMPVKQEKKRRFAFIWIFGILGISTIAYVLINKNSVTQNTTKISTSNFKEFTEKPVNTANEEQQPKTTVQDLSNEAHQKIIDNEDVVVDNSRSNFSSRTIDEKILKTQVLQIKSSEKFTKVSSKSKANNSYNNRTSFSDLRLMKKDRGEIDNVTPNSKENNNTNKYTELYPTQITETNTIESNTKAATNNVNSNLAKTPIKVPKPKVNRNLHYGLQWNILLPQANNYLDLNAKNQPLSIAIPAFWVSKEISTKSELAFQLNPYSQYTLKSNNVLNKADYSVSILQGSSTTPTVINYLQTRTLLKAMGVELTAKYTYKINDKFSVAVGVGNTWLNAAVVNDKLIGQTGKSVHDSLYGIAKGFKEWDYLKSSFIIGRLELLYQLKKMQVGLSFVKPMGNIYSFENSNSNPINGTLVLRWKIK